MKGYFIATLALLSVADATLIIGTTATAGAVTISAGSAALGLLGAITREHLSTQHSEFHSFGQNLESWRPWCCPWKPFC